MDTKKLSSENEPGNNANTVLCVVVAYREFKNQ